VSYLGATIPSVGNYDVALLELAGRQHFVVGRDQLREIGSNKQLALRMAKGVLERIYEDAYRVAGSPKTWQQLIMAATFAGGKLSVASFRSAAQLWNLPGGEEILEIPSQRTRRARHDGIIPHESFFLTERDVTYIDNIPVTRPARTVNDLGLLVETGIWAPHDLDAMLLEATRRNLVDAASVWAEWERLGRNKRPGGEAVEQLLQRFVPPIGATNATEPEVRLLHLVRRAGLPEPVLQHRLWLSATRWVDLDLAWPEAKIFAEFDPYKWHGSRVTYMETIARRLDVETLGWRGVPVTDDELDTGAPRALSLLGTLLGASIGAL